MRDAWASYRNNPSPDAVVQPACGSCPKVHLRELTANSVCDVSEVRWQLHDGVNCNVYDEVCPAVGTV